MIPPDFVRGTLVVVGRWPLRDNGQIVGHTDQHAEVFIWTSLGYFYEDAFISDNLADLLASVGVNDVQTYYMPLDLASYFSVPIN